MPSSNPWGTRLRRVVGAAFGIGLALVLAPGCGRSPEPSEMATSAEAQGLKNLGTMYRIVSEELKRPPRDVGELRKAEARVPGGFNDIGEPNVAIYFGAQPSETGAETVLAYDRVVPRQGGYVLMLDGAVRKMTPEEFKAAKKAGKTPWVAPAGS